MLNHAILDVDVAASFRLLATTKRAITRPPRVTNQWHEPVTLAITHTVFVSHTGEVGIYIDFYDVTPVDRHQYGSMQFMLADFMEKLYEQLTKVSLDVLKCAFEKKHLLNDVIFEHWHKGTVINTCVI